MPTIPSLPPESADAVGTLPTNPMNFLMAAAEAHSTGNFQSMPVPRGKDLQTGKVNKSRRPMKVVR